MPAELELEGEVRSLADDRAASIETTFPQVAYRNSAELDFHLVRRAGYTLSADEALVARARQAFGYPNRGGSELVTSGAGSDATSSTPAAFALASCVLVPVFSPYRVALRLGGYLKGSPCGVIGRPHAPWQRCWPGCRWRRWDAAGLSRE